MAKHLGKVNGVPVFSALHTVVNEWNEVRQMTLTPTKAHNQFIPVISAIPKSLEMYGHGEVEAIYTDNVRADKHELEVAFPSIRKDVIPVADDASLPELLLPEVWRKSTYILSSSYQVAGRINSLLSELDNPKVELTVAMDMEWSFDKNTGVQGKVALIQIAHRQSIHILQVRSYHFSSRYTSDCSV